MFKVFKNNIMMLKNIKEFCPWHITLSMINAVLSSLISVVSLLYLRFIINEIEQKINIEKLFYLILGLFFMNVIYSILNNFLEQKIIPKNTMKLCKNMRLRIYEKIENIDYDSYEDVKFYDKLKCAVEQSDSRALAVLDTFSKLVGGFFGIGALVSLIGYYEPIILLFIGLDVGIRVLINAKISKKQHQYYETRIHDQRKSEYTQRLFSLPMYAKEINLNQKLYELIIERFVVSFKSLENYLVTLTNDTFKVSVEGAICFSAFNFFIMMYLTVKVVYKKLNIANFITMVNGTSQLSNQLIKIIEIFPNLYKHSFYIENYNEFLTYKSNNKENVERMTSCNFNGIKLKKLDFKYYENSKFTLKNIDLCIKRGEIIALVGSNGAGKSTLAKILCGLYKGTNGEYYIDDKRIQEYDEKEMKKKIGVIFQEGILFSFTIAENVLMRTVKKTDENNVINALKYAGIYEKISILPNGIHSNLSKEFDRSGVMFSGGELQKLAIARLYANDYKLIILDEPTTFLDTPSEKEMIEKIIDISKNKILVLITHNLYISRNANQILFMNNGKICERGSHDYLMSLNGDYSKLYKSK